MKNTMSFVALLSLILSLSGCATLSDGDFWTPSGVAAMRDYPQYYGQSDADKKYEAYKKNEPENHKKYTRTVEDDTARVNLKVTEVAPGVKVITGTID